MARIQQPLHIFYRQLGGGSGSSDAEQERPHGSRDGGVGLRLDLRAPVHDTVVLLWGLRLGLEGTCWSPHTLSSGFSLPCHLGPKESRWASRDRAFPLLRVLALAGVRWC